jgi:signal transduction histidine kinase
MASQPAAPTIRWSEVLTPGLLAGFILTIVVLLVTLAVELANLRNVYVTNEAVEDTQSVELALQQILTTMVDAETGERGFIITGEPSYLEPFNRARHVISAQMSELRELTADDLEHQADLDRLFAATELKLKELADAIEQRRNSGFAAGQTAVAANVSKRTMDGMRAIVARMKTREDAVTAERNAQAAYSYRTARMTGFVTTGVAILAVIVLFIGMQRYGAVRLRAAGALETQQAQLREALQQKDDFVALVSHELRTPTNTIAGWAQILEERAVGDDRVQRAIASIRRNADSARQLIEDLMDTTQMVSGRMRLTVADVDIRNVVREAIEAVRLSADNKGVILTDEIQSELPAIRGDAGRLKQVVWNLLANAIKFTPSGGRVTIDVKSMSKGVRLEVRDTGEGIDGSFLPHVFERYRQAAVSTSAQRGVGLGLAIVRHLIELHGGTVTAQSAGPGLGSTFVVELPASVPSLSARPA